MNLQGKGAEAQADRQRRALDAHEAGYQKGMGKRQIQMIAIGGAIGTGLFLGTGGRLQAAGPSLALVYLICGLFSFLFCAHWVSWYCIARPAAALSPMRGSFWGEGGLRGRMDVFSQLGDDRHRRYHRGSAVYALLGRLCRGASVAFCPDGADAGRDHEYDRREVVCRDGVLVCPD